MNQNESIRDPSYIRNTSINIAFVIVKDIAMCNGGIQEISSSSVYDTLRSSGRSRGVQHEERVFAVHPFGGTVRTLASHFFVKPQVTVWYHVSGVVSVLHDENALQVNKSSKMLTSTLGQSLKASSANFLRATERPPRLLSLAVITMRLLAS